METMDGSVVFFFLNQAKSGKCSVVYGKTTCLSKKRKINSAFLATYILSSQPQRLEKINT